MNRRVHSSAKKPKARRNTLPIIALALAIVLVAALNFLNRGQQIIVQRDLQHSDGDDYASSRKKSKYEIKEHTNEKERIQELEQQNERLIHELAVASVSKSTTYMQRSTYQIKASSINSFWWPSLDSGLLAKLSAFQNPSDCSSPKTRFLIWRSMPESKDDTRGLSAWGHTATWQLLHGE